MRKYHRLKGFDYSSPGKYAITLKCVDGIPPMAIIAPDENGIKPIVRLTEIGLIVSDIIAGLPDFYDVTIDIYAIMPDHVHLMLTLGNAAQNTEHKTYLGKIIAGLKSFSTKKYGNKVFIDDYYDIVCYSDERYEKNYDYILSNPAVWIAKHEKKDK